MSDIILTARNTPFKDKWRAVKAIGDRTGYIVVEKDGGYVGIKEVKTNDVQCPGCGQCYHQTTAHYDPEKFANPSMLELKEPWKTYGWEEPPPDATAGYGCLVCPDCGTALAPSGHLRIAQ